MNPILVRRMKAIARTLLKLFHGVFEAGIYRLRQIFGHPSTNQLPNQLLTSMLTPNNAWCYIDLTIIRPAF
jgi:hypothetical protein